MQWADLILNYVIFSHFFLASLLYFSSWMCSSNQDDWDENKNQLYRERVRFLIKNIQWSVRIPATQEGVTL